MEWHGTADRIVSVVKMLQNVPGHVTRLCSSISSSVWKHWAMAPCGSLKQNDNDPNSDTRSDTYCQYDSRQSLGLNYYCPEDRQCQ